MKHQNRGWGAPVAALVLLSFVLGTSEFIVIGILPDIAQGLHTSLAVVGSLVSVFAGAYAVGTPIIAALTSRINKFRLLMGFLAAFFLGNLVSVAASSVGLMYASRIVVAVMSGPILSVSMLFVREIVPESHIARVLSWVFSGFSIASVLGVPLGTILTQRFSYHAAFLFIAAATVLLALLLTRVLPRSTGDTGSGEPLLRQLGILRDPRIYLCIAMSLCGLAGTYVVYTYFTSILEEVLGIGEAGVSPILLVFGLCSIASNLISGKVGEAGGLKRLPVLYGMQIPLFGIMFFALRSTAAGLAALLIMGLLMYIYNTSAQLHFLEVTAEHYPYAEQFASSLLPMSANFGIAVGSFSGSLIQSRAGFAPLPLFALLFECLALCAVLLLKRKMAAGR